MKKAFSVPISDFKKIKPKYSSDKIKAKIKVLENSINKNIKQLEEKIKEKGLTKKYLKLAAEIQEALEEIKEYKSIIKKIDKLVKNQ